MTQEAANIIRPGISRSMDFVRVDRLEKKMGVAANNPVEVLKLIFLELLFNALDKLDASEIKISLQSIGNGKCFLSISDNGSMKLSEHDLELILDFDNQASSKRGLKRVSRGYLGNALKCSIGWSYVLNKGDTETVIESGPLRFVFNLEPDFSTNVINYNLEPQPRADDGFTTLKLEFPKECLPNDPHIFQILVETTALVNPERKITYDILQLSGEINPVVKPKKKRRQETCIGWYNERQFEELIHDYMAAHANLKISDFLNLFRGFSSRIVQEETVKTVKKSLEHLDTEKKQKLQFLPLSSVKNANALYDEMDKRSRFVPARALPTFLGCVGRNFQRIAEVNRWRLKPRVRTRKYDGFASPFLIELAVFYRQDRQGQPVDATGLKIHYAVNFAPRVETIFRQNFDVATHLARCGISEQYPITVVVHLVTPDPEWANDAKTELQHDSQISYEMEKLLNSVFKIPKTPRRHRLPTPPKPYSWVPVGKRLGDEDALASFANKILNINAKRPKIRLASRSWGYVLEGYGLIDKGQFGHVAGALNACMKIGLLPLDFTAEDRDEARHFANILPENRTEGEIDEIIEEEKARYILANTDYWDNEKYFVMMMTEKADVKALFRPICEQYNVPIVASSGQPSKFVKVQIIELCKLAEARGLTPVILLFYDLDIFGWKILPKRLKEYLNQYQRATKWRAGSNIIVERFGLDKDHAKRLTWIENLKSGKGRELHDEEYEEYVGGKRKCETEAIFRDENTMQIAKDACVEAIEKFYGKNALTRFRDKEEKIALPDKQIAKFDEYAKFLKTLVQKKKEVLSRKAEEEEILEVTVDDKYYAKCPNCGYSFNDLEETHKVFSCRSCGAVMRLKLSPEEDSRRHASNGRKC